MAKYYVPFVNFNTFIYEPCGLEENIYYESDFFTKRDNGLPSWTIDRDKIADIEDISINERGYLFINTIGMGSSVAGGAGLDGYVQQHSSLSRYKNYFLSHELPTTSSFLTALNLKRNGPYGYSTWRQIRVGENPLTKNQRKRNILTINTGDDGDVIEVFKEPAFSTREKPIKLFFTNTSNRIGARNRVVDINKTQEIKYFDNDRLNNLYVEWSNLDDVSTNSFHKQTVLSKLRSFSIDREQLLETIQYSHSVFPQKGSLEYNERVRTNFYHPWKDDRTKRKAHFSANSIAAQLIEEYAAYYNGGTNNLLVYRSRWPLDAGVDFLSSTSPKIDQYNIRISDGSNGYRGILQNTGKFVKSLTTRTRVFPFASGYLFPLPHYSYSHTITPLTSCVGPHGMDIEGVNDGTLFNDLDLDHIPSGEAHWDAGSQYGTNPFYDSYEEFVDDIKKVGKDYAFIPEFRSSLFFNDLQAKPNKTPEGFLEVLGGKILDSTKDIGMTIGRLNSLGTTELGYVSASSNDSDFYQVYSHSDFMRNFDLALEVSTEAQIPLYQMSLTCKGIKKFTPYKGFYPAERTVQIANKFRDSIIDSCYYTGSGAGNNVGDILTTDRDRYIYFDNIMTPMFGPGIMFNSIKSGLAVSYPVHTSSLTLENGGVTLRGNDYYIQKPFDERIPFEALVEPADYLGGLEIHCSEPHPSGNLSGSAKWSTGGDTTEYQLMMHNFLAETANFFLKDQNFSFISSKSSREVNLSLEQGKTYGFQINLYKSQNIESDANSSNEMPDLIMTGSGVQETFTMYSRPSAFGPPSRITASFDGSVVTASYSDLGQNYPFTPPYYDGRAVKYVFMTADESRRYTVEEFFNSASLYSTEIRHTPEYSDVGDKRSSYLMNAVNNNYVGNTNNIVHLGDSINMKLGFVQEVDLLDDDTSNTVKVAVDISSDQESQIIIQPKWETPMFNFQTYGDSSTVSLPLIGSQSVPRGMWHQYGQVETDPDKGIFMSVTPLDKKVALYNNINYIGDILGFNTAPVKLGKTAAKKVIREAIVAVPFYEYNPGSTDIADDRKFLNIPRTLIDNALEGNGRQNILDMVNSMQKFVMPPMFNFLEDQNIEPVTMYMFEFSHTLEQSDLAAIWQNLPPKIMTEFQTEEKTISHFLSGFDLMDLSYSLEGEGLEPDEALKRMRWMVFKVKQKAEQNYYNKIVGETKALNKTSTYSHNWPYDYFSLVELAKIDTTVTFNSSRVPLVAPSPSRPAPRITPNPTSTGRLKVAETTETPLATTAPAPTITNPVPQTSAPTPRTGGQALTQGGQSRGGVQVVPNPAGNIGGGKAPSIPINLPTKSNPPNNVSRVDNSPRKVKNPFKLKP